MILTGIILHHKGVRTDLTDPSRRFIDRRNETVADQLKTVLAERVPETFTPAEPGGDQRLVENRIPVDPRIPPGNDLDTIGQVIGKVGRRESTAFQQPIRGSETAHVNHRLYGGGVNQIERAVYPMPVELPI